jgi:hypothetical protein
MTSTPACQRGGINVGGKYKVEIKYYDDESNAQRHGPGRTPDRRGQVFVAGPYGSGSTFPASSVAEK